MQISTYGDFLTQLTRYPKFFPVNCYIVREADGLTLIDAGLPGGTPDILAAAQSIGLPITRIALTHAHGDHTGSLAALHEALPDAEVSVSVRDARLLAGDKSVDPSEPQDKLRGSISRVDIRPTRLLRGGDLVGSLEVVPTPGHTPGHVAFRDRRDGTLIAGDSWQTAGGIAVAGMMRPLFPWPAMATWHLPTALQSARDLLALGPTRLASGHGAVLENPAKAMKTAIEAAAHRQNKRAHS
jgi:glyoxylase-like metal-dependent hydrolase (beta-lactamase superfamily II)